MPIVSVAAGVLLLITGCSASHGSPEARSGGAAGGLSVQEGGHAPGTTACATIACVGGAHFQVDYPLSYAAALDSVVTACRNEICFDMQLPASAQPPTVGSPVGFYNEDAIRSRPERADVFLWMGLRGELFLELRWSPNRPQDGDRYSAQVVDPTGAVYELLDRSVQYRDNSIGRPGAPCFQECKLAKLDLRQSAP